MVKHYEIIREYSGNPNKRYFFIFNVYIYYHQSSNLVFLQMLTIEHIENRE